jgi:ArsR family transcriptional regulator, arsenate/arsenite/antimonite-responsive transcriptional repressor
MLEIINITKALSDENRIRALMMLADGELCVCQIIEMFGLAPSTVSKHMSILRQAGLVETRKDGRWMYYRLTEKGPPSVGEILNWLVRHLKTNVRISEDARQVRRIRKMKKTALCECYRS